MIKRTFLILGLIAFLSVSAQAQSGNNNPDFIYDYMTGEVKIAADGVKINSFQVEMPETSTTPFIPANVDWSDLEAVQDGWPSDTVGEAVTNPEITQFVLGWSVSSGFEIPTDAVLSLGNILPTGLEETDLSGLFTAENIWSNRDSGGGQLDLAVVPEPATMGLLGLGALGVLRRRRR